MTTKKSFTQASPAMAYINIPEGEVEDKANEAQADTTKTTTKAKPRAKSSKQARSKVMITPKDAETKSRRVQILLQPSVYEAVKQLAEDNNTSVNDTINTILKANTIA
ncbi:hypothetical protein [Psychrobacter sp. CAL346-MNA-CIBAN-0220]|uniref:hypothetical protein n=1 Tax=Psychrobacter sp. CAL346-MNA-CIBAN-0220 TaxID=3140457 RepID=UPI00331EDDFF